MEIPSFQLRFQLTVRDGVETWCFKTETRQDFGVPRPRRDARLNFRCRAVFILLTHRKAVEALIRRKSNYPTCFGKCQDIAVWLKFFILVL